MTGVDRSAVELVRALGQIAKQSPETLLQIELAVPGGAPDDEQMLARLELPGNTKIHRSRFKGYLWEQIVLASLCPDATLLSLANMGPISRQKQLVMIHDAQVRDTPASYSLPFRLAYRALQPTLASRAASVVTVSEYSRSRLEEHGIVGGRSIAIVPNGVDHFAAIDADRSTLDRLGLRADGYLLAFGNPAPHKNSEILFKALAKREQPALLPLVLMGDCPSAMETPQVKRIGRVTDGEMKALYQGAQAFLFPSFTEGFGLPVLEAMSCDCPVIASTGGAIPEVAGDAALMCDPHDAMIWAQAMDCLSRSSEKRRKLISAGRDRAESFRWAYSAQKLLKLVERSDGASVAQNSQEATQSHKMRPALTSQRTLADR